MFCGLRQKHISSYIRGIAILKRLWYKVIEGISFRYDGIKSNLDCTALNACDHIRAYILSLFLVIISWEFFGVVFLRKIIN